MKTTLNKRTDSMEQSLQAYAAVCRCSCTMSCPSCGCPCLPNQAISGTVSSASQASTPTSSNDSNRMNIVR